MGRAVLLHDPRHTPESYRRYVEREYELVSRRVELGISPLAAFLAWSLKATILSPAEGVDYSQNAAIKMALRTRIQEQVARTTGQATLIRDLTPSDLTAIANGAAGFSQLSNQNALVADTYFSKDVGFTKVGVNQAIGIFGFVQQTPAPKIQQIRFTQGASVPMAQFWLPPLYADEAANIGYFDPPVIWGPQQSVGIDLLANAAVTAKAENYGLYGFVCEIPGATVMADQANLI